MNIEKQARKSYCVNTDHTARCAANQNPSLVRLPGGSGGGDQGVLPGEEIYSTPLVNRLPVKTLPLDAGGKYLFFWS